jgi:hypothetical protein
VLGSVLGRGHIAPWSQRAQTQRWRVQDWLRFERGCRGRPEADRENAAAIVEKKLPKTLKRKRTVHGPDGSDMGMEEYLDYVYPEEDQAAPLANLLAAAHRWRAEQAAADGGSEER